MSKFMDGDVAKFQYYEEYDDNLPNDYMYYDEEYHPIVKIEDRVEYFNVGDEIKNLIQNCMGTVALQSAKQLQNVLCLCLLFRLVSKLAHVFVISLSKDTKINFLHILSAIFGFVALHSINSETFNNTVYIITFYISSTYVIFHIFFKLRLTCGKFVSVFTVFYLFAGELLITIPQDWHQIRGVLLLLSMKSISVAFSLDSKNILRPPTILSYVGFCLHCGTLLFGPWVEYKDYVNSVSSPKPITIGWVFHVLKSLVFAFVCLLCSTCFLSYLFIDGTQPELPSVTPFVANSWMLSYQSAISFHFSHFYICFISQTTCLLSGIGSENHSNGLVWSEFRITKPFSVEIPMSMLNVVVAWNTQMSRWLKEYIFNAYKSFGRTTAILLTYVASAMLHGLSFHLAAVLLSLAFYTYVEYTLRLKLSIVFDCPYIQARPKPKEGNNSIPILAHVFNFSWVLINLMHLAYLGAMFQSEDETIAKDGYPMKHTLEKWANLKFFSHGFAFACFVFNKLI